VGGALGTTADVIGLLLLVKFAGLSIPIAAFCAAAGGACICFLMNRRFAFRDRSPITAEKLARFGAVAFGSSLLIALLMKLVAVELMVPVLPAKLLCAAIVFLAWTYPAQRRLVFARPQRSPAASLA
jgi:putative flippase GtrA